MRRPTQYNRRFNRIQEAANSSGDEYGKLSQEQVMDQLENIADQAKALLLSTENQQFRNSLEQLIDDSDYHTELNIIRNAMDELYDIRRSANSLYHCIEENHDDY